MGFQLANLPPYVAFPMVCIVQGMVSSEQHNYGP